MFYFYPKDDTPGCTKEAQGFSAAKADFYKLNAVILGISKDSVASHEKFCNKYDLNLILLSDPDCIVQKDYAVWKEKSMYGRTYFGTERSTFIINSKGVVEKEWRKVKVKEHVSSVLSYLKETVK